MRNNKTVKPIIGILYVLVFVVGYLFGGNNQSSFDKQVTDMRESHYMIPINNACPADYPIKSNGKCFDNVQDATNY